MDNVEFKWPTVYAGFWLRFCAMIVDGIIYLLAIGLPLSLIFPSTKEIYLGTYILHAALNPIFTTGFLVKYGATPGKMLLRLKVKKVDLGAIDLKDALLRQSVTIFVILLGIIGTTIVVNRVDLSTLQDASGGLFTVFFSPEKKEAATKAGQVITQADPLNIITGVLGFLWLLAEVITLLTNEKRRAAHDYIAGTVVVQEPKKPPVAPAT